ncbi:hypothetical protein COCON_G00146760 [Conger conger]|uniref:THAP domain-containing protein 1 n=1 Tax=Conger conger TaxID=82655 RepID=A0A9Q1HUG8_CONCO|nr:hypothetical protein COCON_G00146760 [Conger conger]
MSKAHMTCAVAGCTAAHVSMHTLPRDTALRQEWVNFIFSNKVPEYVSQHLRLCTAHFSPYCIENQARYNAGFASKLVLRPGAVPTVLNPDSDVKPKLPTFTREVGCQTDPPKNEKRTVCTQLGTYTLLHKHVKSRATQDHLSFKQRRHYLAGMHFNENVDQSQTISSTGQLAYMIKYPKSRDNASFKSSGPGQHATIGTH